MVPDRWGTVLASILNGREEPDAAAAAAGGGQGGMDPPVGAVFLLIFSPLGPSSFILHVCSGQPTYLHREVHK